MFIAVLKTLKQRNKQTKKPKWNIDVILGWNVPKFVQDIRTGSRLNLNLEEKLYNHKMTDNKTVGNEVPYPKKYLKHKF